MNLLDGGLVDLVLVVAVEGRRVGLEQVVGDLPCALQLLRGEVEASLERRSAEELAG